MEAFASGAAGADRRGYANPCSPQLSFRAAGSVGRLTMSTEAQEHSKIEQLQHTAPDEIEVAAGREREDLQGWVPTLASDQVILDALEKAFDYRGDVTITKKDGSTVEGYIFDRRIGATLAASQ